MSLTVVNGRGHTDSISAEEFDGMRRSRARTVVDVGTGDGRFAYYLATTRREDFIVGLDPVGDTMGEIARKASRKAGKGGVSNLLLVRGAIESLPDDLQGIADEVHVLLPWGRLLEGIILDDSAVACGLVSLCAPGARIRMVLNAEAWINDTPVRYADLPRPTPAYVATSVTPRFAGKGMRLGEARYLSGKEVKALRTTWAKRLRHGRPHAEFLQVEGIADPVDPRDLGP